MALVARREWEGRWAPDGVTRRDVNAGNRARLERWAGVGLREWGTAERFRLGSRASLSANESPSGR